MMMMTLSSPVVFVKLVKVNINSTTLIRIKYLGIAGPVYPITEPLRRHPRVAQRVANTWEENIDIISNIKTI